MSLETPSEIRKLQIALCVKAKREPKFRFYSLYDKVCRVDILDHAWRLCRSKNGSPGVDGVTFDHIESSGVEAWLKALQAELSDKTYKPSPVRRVMIPKAGGIGQRPLGIPTIRDRVVQAAAKLVLEPIFEADFDDAAYAYRPKRRALDALVRTQEALRDRRTEVVDADITKYFDSIPHDMLMRCLTRRIADGAMLRLIKLWLKAPVEETNSRGRKHMSGGQKARCGIPQGGVISPVLANIYMRRFILLFRRSDLAAKLGAVLVNYADDFVVLCRANARIAHAKSEEWLYRIGLALNATKTSVKNAWKAPFTFLGYRFGLQYRPVNGGRYLGVSPAKKAVKAFRQTIRAYLRHNHGTPLDDVITGLNRKIVGWGAYFSYGSVARPRAALDCYVPERLRAFLRRRHKLLGKGKRKFSHRYIRDVLGLTSFDSLPRWRPAHAST